MLASMANGLTSLTQLRGELGLAASAYRTVGRSSARLWLSQPHAFLGGVGAVEVGGTASRARYAPSAEAWEVHVAPLTSNLDSVGLAGKGLLYRGSDRQLREERVTTVAAPSSADRRDPVAVAVHVVSALTNVPSTTTPPVAGRASAAPGCYSTLSPAKWSSADEDSLSVLRNETPTVQAATERPASGLLGNLDETAIALGGVRVVRPARCCVRGVPGSCPLG